MSQATYQSIYPDSQAENAGAMEPPFVPRSKHAASFFLVCVVLSGISWLSGGLAEITDLAFVCLGVACAVLAGLELVQFPRRFGLGALVVYVGSISWFCYDYFSNWFGIDFGSGVPYTAQTIAKAAYFHCFFLLFAVVGLSVSPPRWSLRWAVNLPEPRDPNLYFGVSVIAIIIGLLPYAVFNADGFFHGLYNAIIGGRSGLGGWTVGRTGNANYSWGAYISVPLQIGQVGAILGIAYAVLISRSIVQICVCWGSFLLQAALQFGSGTRGFVAFSMLPLMMLWYIKYQAQAAMMFRRFAPKAYILSATAGVTVLIAIQIQGAFRNSGFDSADLGQISFTELRGNSMFSEGLTGWALIPETSGFFSSRFPGDALFFALPETAWRFIIGPMPRALWPTKPFDELLMWHKSVVTGADINDPEGTTVSTGLVGEWYFRYGWLGVVQGGLLFGLLARWCEILLLESEGRLLQLLLALGTLTWLFRCFRNFSFPDLYPLLIGLFFFWVVIRVTGAKQCVSLTA